MYLFCPKCQTQHPSVSRCPKCSSRLLSPTEASEVLSKAAAAPPPLPVPTFASRVIVGTLVALGLHLGLREWVDAAVSGILPNVAPDVLFWIGFALRVAGTLVGGAIAGSGRTKAFSAGLSVGVVSGFAWLLVDPFPNVEFDLLRLGLTAALAAAGGIASVVGGWVWPPAIELPTVDSPRQSSLFKLKPETEEGKAGWPTNWVRILLGAAVAIIGVAAADYVRVFIVKAPGLANVSGELRAGLVDFELVALFLCIGALLAGASTGAGLRHGSIAGGIVAASVMGIHYLLPEGHPAVSYFALQCHLDETPAYGMLAAGLVSFGVVTLFGWVGGQLLPPLREDKKRSLRELS